MVKPSELATADEVLAEQLEDPHFAKAWDRTAFARAVAHPGWHTLMGAIAVESGAFVVSVRSFQPHSAFPGDFPAALPEEDLQMIRLRR
jgi:hypothetical protein